MTNFKIEIYTNQNNELELYCNKCNTHFCRNINDFPKDSTIIIKCDNCNDEAELVQFLPKDTYMPQCEEIATNYALDLIKNMFK